MVPHIAKSIQPTTVIVVADVDLITDQLAYAQGLFGGYQLRNANSTFFLNCLDFLSGSQDLISIRNRGSAQRSCSESHPTPSLNRCSWAWVICKVGASLVRQKPYPRMVRLWSA